MSKINKTISSYLARLKNGEKCSEEFYDYSYGYIEAIAYKYLADKSKTDEIVNNTFGSVFRNLYKFDPKDNGLVWLYELAKTEALELNGKYNLRAEVAADTDCPFDNASAKFALYHAISRLDEDDQNLIDMRILQDLDINTIARLKGMSKREVCKNIERIYKLLRETTR